MVEADGYSQESAEDAELEPEQKSVCPPLVFV